MSYSVIHEPAWEVRFVPEVGKVGLAVFDHMPDNPARERTGVMGADAWKLCLNCKRRQVVEIAAAEAELADAYGKVSADTYREMEVTVRDIRERKLDETLRCDYEQFIDSSGKYNCYFKAWCDVCHFSWEHERHILVPGLTEVVPA
jgi:hypothetical protein